MNDYSLTSIWENGKNTVKGWFGFGSDKLSAEAMIRHRSGATALQYYDGNAPKQLTTKPNQPDDNVFVNYPEVIVDKGVSFLFGDELKISIGSDEDSSGEEYLESVWNQEQRSEDLMDAATDGAIFGDVYFKIRINEIGAPEVITLDPQNIRVECDPQNFRKIQKFVFYFKRSETDFYKEETAFENGRWIIREFESKNGSNWNQIGTDIFWQWSFCPIFHSKNLPKSKSFYGKPDLTRNVLELSRYLSRLDSLIGRIIRAHSSPKSVAVGLQKQDMQIGSEDIIFLPGGDKDSPVDLKLLEMTGDLAGAMGFRKQIREALAEISKVPEVATGKTENIGQLSGYALQILYGPLIEQTKKKQRLYGAVITRVVAALLEIGGKLALAKQVKLQWANPIPSDPKEDADTGISLKQIGVSEDTILKRLGFDPKHERQMKKLDSNTLADTLGNAFNSGKQNSETYQ